MPQANIDDFIRMLELSGYWNFYVDMTDQQRFDLLGGKFWALVGGLGFNVAKLKALCWRKAGRPRDEFIVELLS